MSALPPKADIRGRAWNIGYGPIADIQDNAPCSCMSAFAVNDSRRQAPQFFPAVFSRERAADQVLRRISPHPCVAVQDVHDSN